MILRSLPEDSFSGATLGARIEALSQREHSLVLARATQAEMPLGSRPLMIAAARGGRETYTVERRRLAVDDDNFLVLNEGRAHSSVIRSESEVESFKIFFRAGMVAEVLAPLVLPADRLLERAPALGSLGFEFCEGLQPNDRTVAPALHVIRQHLIDTEVGKEDNAWLEERLTQLLESLLLGHREVVARVKAIPVARDGTRKEIYRRVVLAVDYIESYYEQPIELDTLAQVACLSKFHFLRAFRSMQGMTPQHYVRRKRALVAKRLLATTALPAAEIALRVGYASRTSLTKQVRYWTGAAPAEIRRLKF